MTQHTRAIKKSGPAIKAKRIVAKRLSEMGINLVALANNHIMDFGPEGLKDTIGCLVDEDLAYVGAGICLEEAKKPYIITVDGKKLVVLNFCENEWSTTQGAYMGANPIDEIANYYQIQKAKDSADYVLVIAHGGHEHYSLPSPRIKKLYRFYADAGATAVVAHHTHCSSGYEVYNGVPIMYSLGNFFFANSGKRNSHWNKGMLALLNFQPNSCSFKFVHFDQCNGDSKVKIVTEDESSIRNREIDKLNLLIQDDFRFNKEYQFFLESNYKMYRSYLEPHSNRCLNFLQNRRILPSLWSKKKKIYLLNLVRCESHHDVILNLLKDEVSHSQ